jgi:hypothetical protein
MATIACPRGPPPATLYPVFEPSGFSSIPSTQSITRIYALGLGDRAVRGHWQRGSLSKVIDPPIGPNAATAMPVPQSHRYVGGNARRDPSRPIACVWVSAKSRRMQPFPRSWRLELRELAAALRFLHCRPILAGTTLPINCSLIGCGQQRV